MPDGIVFHCRPGQFSSVFSVFSHVHYASITNTQPDATYAITGIASGYGILHLSGMDDKPIEEMTNQELADCLRDGGGCQHEALARLLEADAKNHDLVAGQESKWRDMLVEVVLAYEFVQTPVPIAQFNESTDRLRGAIKKARSILAEGEMTLPQEAINQPISKEEAELLG